MLPPSTYESIPIADFDDLLNYSKHLPHKEKPQWWLFRGTPRAFDLKTSLERALDDAGVPLSEAVEIERQMLKEFKRRAHFYIDPLPNTGDILGWLALMQHWGAPTRFLDWTYSFYVAAFFALADATSFPEQERQPAVVWALYRDDFTLATQAPTAYKAYLAVQEKRSWREDVGRSDADGHYDALNGFLLSVMEKPERSVWAINPFRLNERLSVQQGVFLCQGDVRISFEENLKAASPAPDRLLRFDLSTEPAARKAMLEVLHKMNINNASLFPGLDGYSRSLRQTAWVRFRLRPNVASHEK